MIYTTDVIDALRTLGYDAHHAPQRHQEHFITVDRVTSKIYNKLDHATFLIKFWDVDEYRAECAALEFCEQFYKSDLSNFMSLGNVIYMPDPEGNMSRYQIEVTTTSTI